MRIDVLCASRRGCLVLERLFFLAQNEHFRVVSFKEDPGEPPFLADIQQLAVNHGAEFLEARYLNSSNISGAWEEPADLMLIVGWRYMIPRAVFSRVALGAYVFHDSLLPRYRGFSPTVWAMINGEAASGATLFEIADEVDAGPIIAQKQTVISSEDTIATVMARVKDLYLDILTETLPSLMSGHPKKTPQDHALATYACKRLEADNRIEWSGSTLDIYNLIRAVSRPYSGAFTYANGTKMRVWRASIVTEGPRYIGRVAGRVVSVAPDGVLVLTGDGVLKLQEVQLENGQAVAANSVITSLKTTLNG